MFLVCVNAFSKWPEVKVMSTTTTVSKTLNMLRERFVVHGIPEQIMDNGPQFIAEEFDEFTKHNGIKREECTLSPCFKWVSRMVH